MRGSDDSGSVLSADRRAAIRALERFPAVRPARERLLEALVLEPQLARVVGAIESDVALTVTVLRSANRGPRRGTVASVVEAVGVLGDGRLRALAEGMPVYDFFRRPEVWSEMIEQFRLHALAVHRGIDRLAQVAGERERDELLTLGLVHDIGKLPLIVLDPECTWAFEAGTPEERLERERRRVGTDHAELGGEAARWLGLPESLAAGIAGHHSEAASGCAALVRLADLLAHYAQGDLVELEQLIDLSRRIGISEEKLGTLMYELPQPLHTRRASLYPCPLSERELEVLRGLAEGKVYKQIGHELGLSASTVRSHLHRIYSRIGAGDRTQAVLVAAERGWI